MFAKIEYSTLKHITLVCLVFFFNTLSLSFAQWEPDVRLTFDAATSYTSYNNAWCVAAHGENIHVAWYDFRDGNNEIYYKYSPDAGTTWETDTRLTDDPANSLHPSVAVSDAYVHVVWHDRRDGNDEIYYKRSMDGGTTWETDTRLTDDPAYSGYPCVVVSDSNVHVVWYDFRDGSPKIFYKRSTDGGSTWESDIQLTDDPADSEKPSVAVSGTTVHVVWNDFRDGNLEIYYKRSMDGGTTWETDTRLTDDPADSEIPSVAVSGDNVHVVWYDARDGNSEIYYKYSPDAGTTWETDTRLTDDPADSEKPNVAVSDSNVHAVWQDFRDGNDEIYYKRSTDGGTTWETDTRLTDNPLVSGQPSIAVSDSNVHVVWQDDRDGNLEIYYKRNPTGNPGIEESSTTVGLEITRYLKVFPNPMRGRAEIKYSVSEQKYLSLRIYNVSGQIISTIFEGERPPGSYSDFWSVRDNAGKQLPSGVYFLKFQAGDYSATEKLLLIR